MEITFLIQLPGVCEGGVMCEEVHVKHLNRNPDPKTKIKNVEQMSKHIQLISIQNNETD